MEHVREELDRLILKGGYGYASISRLLGRNPAYVQQFIRRGSPRKLDDEDRKTLACFFGVDEQVLGGPANPVTDGMVEIPVLDVEASAGFGAVAASETAHTRFGFDERWLRHLTSAKSASLSIVGVKGDSMEPTLSDGDEVLVDASDHGSRLRDGIYVLRSDDTLVVKRIAIKPNGRQITIASDNPAYPTWHDMDRSEVHVVGRVIWFGRAL
ncbi:S24 family peptidase [Qipengyuania sp. CAU 1752]|jgi:phage repressor protein C with HTH and peptisase S24 domain|uniref:S24 family peptidase n=2 Tax=Erythrobacteraceae TaxID=335929 RepID=A0A7D4B7V5_9SPHN|nr:MULTISPECIES: S24 family peptidase [Erythrobacteraceae]QKG71283.1 S24 family peptidase [Erythrobacter mangrovi]QUL39028.1 S24 family peptidase [Erythrobacter sp. JK5]WFL77406.1 S24 family peptidase [Altererythrobacter sp. CAU 1644]